MHTSYALKDKHALVTGASKGIGRAVAIALAQAGASVAINYRSDKAAAEEVLAECDKHSKGNFIVQADTTKPEDIAKLFQAIKERFEGLDVLVNNSGVFDEADSPHNPDAFERIFQQNLLSHVRVTDAALQLMKTGKIVNISSTFGQSWMGRKDSIAYASLKAALDSYTKTLAKVVAPDILVNAVAPGKTLTPMWGDLSEDDKHELGATQLINRFIEPEEIADAVLFLVRNNATTGTILLVDGGMSLKVFG